jgi:hypothetical protein
MLKHAVSIVFTFIFTSAALAGAGEMSSGRTSAALTPEQCAAVVQSAVSSKDLEALPTCRRNTRRA